jgi:hypothetical protein
MGNYSYVFCEYYSRTNIKSNIKDDLFILFFIIPICEQKIKAA